MGKALLQIDREEEAPSNNKTKCPWKNDTPPKVQGLYLDIAEHVRVSNCIFVSVSPS